MFVLCTIGSSAYLFTAKSPNRRDALKEARAVYPLADSYEVVGSAN